ncbi:MAG TPA: gephyrin-like molybdotransferase Glp [Bacteroidales bacterium]|nr:gephyrin-like molybdotransferase Glp [Bacteroidales bacterium]
MILFKEALEIVTGAARQLPFTPVSLAQAHGRVLAQDVFSDMDMPPFDKSAMDGYACRRADLDKPLEVIEIIPAGVVPTKMILPGTCSKLMTGGMLPKGADMVIVVEETEPAGENRIRFTGTKSSDNFCRIGEDLRENDLVLKSGTLLRPQHIAILSSVGCVEPLVYDQPVMGVLSTGDELVEPHQRPAPSQIRNSNAAQLLSQIDNIGARPVYFGIVADTLEATREAIEAAINKCNILLLSGGVSMGDFDYVPQVLRESGFEVLFHSIAVQPGRPTVFARKEKTYLFGLPGNPVSSFVQFELLVKPFIFALMGSEYSPVQIQMPMGTTYTRRNTRRKSFIPVIIKQGKVFPVDYNGSAHIHAYVEAQGIVPVEIGKTTLAEGELTDVRLI